MAFGSDRQTTFSRAAIVAPIIGAGLTLFNQRRRLKLVVIQLNRAVSGLIYEQAFIPITI